VYAYSPLWITIGKDPQILNKAYWSNDKSLTSFHNNLRKAEVSVMVFPQSLISAATESAKVVIQAAIEVGVNNLQSIKAASTCCCNPRVSMMHEMDDGR